METSRGWQLGQVIEFPGTHPTTRRILKPIDRKATPRDLVMRQTWQQKEAEVVLKARERVSRTQIAWDQDYHV